MMALVDRICGTEYFLMDLKFYLSNVRWSMMTSNVIASSVECTAGLPRSYLRDANYRRKVYSLHLATLKSLFFVFVILSSLARGVVELKELKKSLRSMKLTDSHTMRGLEKSYIASTQPNHWQALNEVWF